MLVFFFIYTLGLAIYFVKPLKSSITIKNLLGIIIALFLLGVPLAQAYQYYVYHFYWEIVPINKDAVRTTIFYITLPLLWLVIPKTELKLDEKLHFKEIWVNLKNYKEHKKNYKLFALMGIAIIVTIVFMSVLWLIFPSIIGFFSLCFKEMKWKVAILCFMIAIVSINDNTGVRFDHNRRLGEDMNKLIEDGDVVMLDEIDFIKPHNLTKINAYILAPYVTKSYRIINSDSNETPDFIITQNDTNIYENYTIINKYYNNDNKGIFTQIYSELYKTFRKPKEIEKKVRIEIDRDLRI
jgi:hypothetical protein